MTPSRASLIEHFRSLADDYLIEVHGSGTLIPLAQELAEKELTRRGIAHRPVPAQCEGPAAAGSEGPVILETVTRSLVTSQLEVLRARLEAEGIPAFVMDGNMNQAYSLVSPAMGGARLQVPREYVAAAREIIAAMNSGVLAVKDGDDTTMA